MTVPGNEIAPTPHEPIVETLRSLSAADIEDFARLLPQLSDKPRTEEDTAQNLLNVLSSPTSRIVVIRDENNRIQASATGNLCPIPTGFKPWIDDVVTDENYRGRGYSTLLIEALHDWAARSGAESINLTSKPEREDARRFYERIGYALRGTGVFRAMLNKISPTE